MKMVLASKNNHKLKEMQDILSAQGVELGRIFRLRG